MSSTPTLRAETDEEERVRFQVELEFVQCLANPAYLHYLSQFRFFEDRSFVNYLKYLQYWRRPEYAKFVVFPHCLCFLELLQDQSFRDALAQDQAADMVYRQQHLHWKFHRDSRPNRSPAPASSSDEQQQQREIKSE